MESISCILYFLPKLEKLGVQCFKWCMNWSSNEEVMAVWRQLHKAVRKFRSCEISCEINLLLRKFRSPKPILHLRNEIHLRNFARCFAAAKPPASTRVPLRKLKLHLRNCEPHCEITSKLRIKLQIISKLRNHLQVVKSQIQLAKSKFKLEKWIIQHVNHLAKSTRANSNICNRLS